MRGPKKQGNETEERLKDDLLNGEGDQVIHFYRRTGTRNKARKFLQTKLLIGEGIYYNEDGDKEQENGFSMKTIIKG